MTSQIMLINEKGLANAVERLHAGKLVAFPTETVYGLGADATNADSVAGIFAVKTRPLFNPLIIHIASLTHAKKFGKFNASAEKLAQNFWPGGLTLVVPKTNACPICDLALAGGDTVALRMPANKTAQQLLSLSGLAIAAPSANCSGRLSPTRPEHVKNSFGNKADILILDGGACALGLESTIIGCLPEGDFLLRWGAIEVEVIEKCLGKKLLLPQTEGDKKLSPGRLASHYAPNAQLRLNATNIQPDEALLAFGKSDLPHSFNLSLSGNLPQAAKNFFTMLHQMDTLYDKIAVAPIPNIGLGRAINDRLRRAATKT